MRAVSVPSPLSATDQRRNLAKRKLPRMIGQLRKVVSSSLPAIGCGGGKQCSDDDGVVTGATAMASFPSGLNPRAMFPQLVNFRNLNSCYKTGEDILLVLEYSPGLKVGVGDWVGLFPSGWSSLDHFAAFQAAPIPAKRSPVGHRFLYTLVFRSEIFASPNQVRNVNNNNNNVSSATRADNLYQFVFISDTFQAILGSSELIQIEPLNDAQLTEYNFEHYRRSLNTSIAKCPFGKTPLMSSHLTVEQLIHERHLHSGPRVTQVVAKGECLGHASNHLPFDRDGRDSCSRRCHASACTTLYRQQQQRILIDDSQSTLDKPATPGTFATVKRLIAEKLRLIGTDINENRKLVSVPDAAALPHDTAAFDATDVLRARQQLNGQLEVMDLMRQMMDENAQLMKTCVELRKVNQRLQTTLQEQTRHLNDIYYTLHKHGFSFLKMVTGEHLDLSLFHGNLLELEQDQLTRLVIGAGSPQSQFSDTGDAGIYFKHRPQQNSHTMQVYPERDHTVRKVVVGGGQPMSMNDTKPKSDVRHLAKLHDKTKYLQEYIDWLEDVGTPPQHKMSGDSTGRKTSYEDRYSDDTSPSLHFDHPYVLGPDGLPTSEQESPPDSESRKSSSTSLLLQEPVSPLQHKAPPFNNSNRSLVQRDRTPSNPSVSPGGGRSKKLPRQQRANSNFGQRGGLLTPFSSVGNAAMPMQNGGVGAGVRRPTSPRTRSVSLQNNTGDRSPGRRRMLGVMHAGAAARAHKNGGRNLL